MSPFLAAGERQLIAMDDAQQGPQDPRQEGE
jgi:hypothetical protein